MNAEAFAAIAVRLTSGERAQNGIGTLGERTLHAALKEYYEPLESCREVRLGRYVADICRIETAPGGVGDGSIVEIQTRGFFALRKKLEAFLPGHVVTVVYPIARVKWLSWIDEDTGEVSARRRSPKVWQPASILPELYRIEGLLEHPNLRLCIPCLELEEYRRLNGWSRDRKRGSWRHERIPVALLGEVHVGGAGEYGRLIPTGLADGFTSKEFAKAAGLSPKAAQTALHVLCHVGAVARTGKRGRSFVYAARSPGEQAHT